MDTYPLTLPDADDAGGDDTDIEDVSPVEVVDPKPVWVPLHRGRQLGEQAKRQGG